MTIHTSVPEYVCEHGYPRCDGCDDCAYWAETIWADDERVGDPGETETTG